MRIFLSILLFVLSVESASAVGIKFRINNRSGTLDDDYVAEPLSKLSKKYENALKVSNEILVKIKAKNYSSIYDVYFDEKLKTMLSKERFETQMLNLEGEYGDLVRFKKMQWGFFTTEENGETFLCSKKIVEHQRTMLKYLFVFRNDGDFYKIVGIQIRERKGVQPPGVF